MNLVDMQRGLLFSAIAELVVRMGYDMLVDSDPGTGDLVFHTEDSALELRISRAKLESMGFSTGVVM